MRTMQPSVTIGSYTWAQDRLPYDEFTLRLGALHFVPSPFAVLDMGAHQHVEEASETGRVDVAHGVFLSPV